MRSLKVLGTRKSLDHLDRKFATGLRCYGGKQLAKEKKDQSAKSFVEKGIGTVNGLGKKEMDCVFGAEQLPYLPDRDPFDQASSDSESDDYT